MSTAAKTTSFLVRLKGREEVAERTLALHLEKPQGFMFKPGQYVDVTLTDPPETDAEGNTRSFSLAGAPHEDTLMVATRMRDTAFKRVIAKMPVNSTIKLEGPFGNLTLHNNVERPAVLIAGGLGITPFRSIVLRAAKEKLGHRIYLFYSNRRCEDAPFLSELQAAEKQNPNYRFIGVMTAAEKSSKPWSGERGHIDGALLSKVLGGNMKNAIYYIAGPPAMVAGLQGVLLETGVNEDDIRTEEFAGY